MARKKGTLTILNDRTELVPIDSVRPHPRNVNEADLGAIIESINQNGFYGSLIVQRSTGNILVGTHRWRAMKERGAAEIPVTYVDVDDDRALRIMLADNRTARLGHDDTARLAELLQELQATPDALSGTGFDGDDLDALLEELGRDWETAETDPPEMQKADELAEKWETAVGQIWQVGRHRLLIGNSWSAEDVETLLGGAVVDGICTDPPYDMAAGDVVRAFEGHGNVAVVLAADKLAFDLVKFWDFRLDLIWYHRKPRKFPTLNLPILYHLHVLVLARSKSVKTQWTKARSDFGSVIETERDYEDAGGFGQGKPVELFAAMLSGFGWKTVYDPFAGTGTTILACEQTGRTCFAMELSPTHAAVGLERCLLSGLPVDRLADPASDSICIPTSPAAP